MIRSMQDMDKVINHFALLLWLSQQISSFYSMFRLPTPFSFSVSAVILRALIRLNTILLNIVTHSPPQRLSGDFGQRGLGGKGESDVYLWPHYNIGQCRDQAWIADRDQ